MAASLPPVPINEPPGSLAWQQWYLALQSLYGTTGAIPWINIDTAGSAITDIATRPHNSLTSIQGGAANDYYHLTLAQHTDLTDAGDSALHFHSADRASANFTGTNWTDLTDGGDSTLHIHSADRARANHTGTQTISTLSDLPTLTAWSAFTPARTGWTDVGAPTVTGRQCQVRNVGYMQVKVIPGTTCATVAGTSYIDLPIIAGASGISGDGSMLNSTTLIGVGNCAFDIANSRIYVPTQGATANTLVIAAWWEV